MCLHDNQVVPGWRNEALLNNRELQRIENETRTRAPNHRERIGVEHVRGGIEQPGTVIVVAFNTKVVIPAMQVFGHRSLPATIAMPGQIDLQNHGAGRHIVKAHAHARGPRCEQGEDRTLGLKLHTQRPVRAQAEHIICVGNGAGLLLIFTYPN